jgi:hypothetical protein
MCGNLSDAIVFSSFNMFTAFVCFIYNGITLKSWSVAIDVESSRDGDGDGAGDGDGDGIPF